MNSQPRKRSLVVLRRGPYGGSLARAAADLALAMGAFEQDFDLLFTGAGVLQLLPHQDSQRIGLKNIGKALSALPLFDVERVYVDKEALLRHGITAENLVVPAQVLSAQQIRPLLDGADHLISC